jgi:hypothetical protein
MEKNIIPRHLIESSCHFLNQVVRGRWGLATSLEKRELNQVSLKIDLWGLPTSPFPILLGWNNT